MNSLLISCPDSSQVTQLSRSQQYLCEKPSKVIGLPTSLSGILPFILSVSCLSGVKKRFFLSPQQMSCNRVEFPFLLAFLSGRVWCGIRLVASQVVLRCSIMVWWTLQDAYILVVSDCSVLLEDTEKGREQIC